MNSMNTQIRKELLALAYCGLASVEAQRVGRDKPNAQAHLQRAEEHAKFAMKLLPKNPNVLASAHTALGVAYSNSKDYSRATDQLKRAIEIKQDYWRAYIYLGQTEMANSKLDDAIVALEQATTLNPGFEYAQYQLGQALRRRGEKTKNDLTRAAEAYGKAKKIAAAHNELGRIYAQSGNLEKAIEEFRQALSINNRYSDALADLAWYILEAGQTDQQGLRQSLEYAKRALDLEEGKPSEWHKRAILGRVYLEQGHLEKANNEFRESLRLAPNRSQSYYFLARSLFKQGRLQEARESLIKMFQLANHEQWEKPAADLMQEISSALQERDQIQR